MTAAIGIAAGLGRWGLALVSTVLTWITLSCHRKNRNLDESKIMSWKATSNLLLTTWKSQYNSGSCLTAMTSLFWIMPEFGPCAGRGRRGEEILCLSYRRLGVLMISQWFVYLGVVVLLMTLGRVAASRQ